MKVHIKVWTSDLKECEQFVFPCHESNRDALVDRFAWEVKQRFPGNDLRIVRIGSNRFNIIPAPMNHA